MRGKSALEKFSEFFYPPPDAKPNLEWPIFDFSVFSKEIEGRDKSSKGRQTTRGGGEAAASKSDGKEGAGEE